MGIFDTIFGRQKPVPVGPERLFAMSTAEITLETEQHLKTTGSVALCFKGMASGPFQEIQQELEQLLQLTGKDSNTTIKPFQDSYGYRWFILTDNNDFQALVTALHAASTTLIDRGYGSQLLFAIFAFTNDQNQHIYWIYNYKRSSFYPFVPQTNSHDTQRRRDNPEELRLSAALAKDLPIEQETERWFAVWNLPMD